MLLSVRVNPVKLEDLDVQTLLGAAGRDPQVEQQMRTSFSQRGLWVCDESSRNPLTKLEKYYYIYSSESEGLQQDRKNLGNRSFALPLRGDRDFALFLQAGKSRLEFPDVTSSEFTAPLAGEMALPSIAPAAAGIFVESVFY